MTNKLVLYVAVLLSLVLTQKGYSAEFLEKPPAPHPDRKQHFIKPKAPLMKHFLKKQTEAHPIILIVVDAFRADHLSLNGYPRTTTPHLDAFAKEAVNFSTSYANAPWTKPSVTTMLTGLLPSQHGVQEERSALDENFVTLPEKLKESGYLTMAVVGNGNASGAFNLHQGFDLYMDTRTHWDGLPTANQVLTLLGDWLEQHASMDKLFSFAFIVDPHDPYHTPNPEDESKWLWRGHPPLIRTPRWEYPPEKGLSIEQRWAMSSVYDAAINYADQELGKLFERLKKLNLYDRSTIIVTSDHGEAFGEHGVYLHAHHLYEEHVRVPFLIKSPAIPKSAQGKHITSVVAQGIDVYPTVSALAGITLQQTDDSLLGIDILAEARRPNKNRNRLVYSEYNCFGIHRTMLRRGNIKLILQSPAQEERFLKTVKRKDLLPSVVFDKEEIKFYNLKQDPFERKPALSQQQLHPRQRRVLGIMRHYLKHVPQHNAPVITHLDDETISDLRSLGYIN